MDAKKLIWIGMVVGGAVGGYLPFLWGDNNAFSFSSLLLGAVGSIVGIWAGFKISRF